MLAGCPGQAGSGGCANPSAMPALPTRQWDSVGNYRPVGLTSVLDDIMEELRRDLVNKKLKEVIQ